MQASSDTRLLCESMLDASLKDPIVVYLLTCLKKSGCPMSRAAIRCDALVEKEVRHASSGFFDVKRGIIINEACIDSSVQLTDTLRHELIHAFDYCRANLTSMDPAKRACSEIRAAALSGECKWTREFMRGNVGLGNIRKLFQECIRRRSAMSLSSYLGEETAKELIDKYMDICISDTSPFIDIP